jgi:hypothetical protein
VHPPPSPPCPPPSHMHAGWMVSATKTPTTSAPSQDRVPSNCICRCSRMRTSLSPPRVLLPHTCTQDGWFLQPKRLPPRLPRRTVPSNCICRCSRMRTSLSPPRVLLPHTCTQDGWFLQPKRLPPRLPPRTVTSNCICRCSRMRTPLPPPRVLLPHTCTQDGWFLQPKRRPVLLPRRTVTSNCISKITEGDNIRLQVCNNANASGQFTRIVQRKKFPWEKDSIVKLAYDLVHIQDCNVQVLVGQHFLFNKPIPKGVNGRGYLRVTKNSLWWQHEQFPSVWTSEGLTTCMENGYQWTVNSTTWNHLQTMWQAPPLDLLRLIYEETHHQTILEASGLLYGASCVHYNRSFRRMWL